MPTVHVLPGGATLVDVGNPGATSPRPACIVCPGGAYGWLSWYEGDPVAHWLESVGVRGFLLNYRVAPNRHPAPLNDAQFALRLVRTHAAEWGVLPDNIGILGFSAGGHVASTACTHFKDDVERPDFSLLIYPVISLSDTLGHIGSRQNLLGMNPDPTLVENLSNEKQVNKRTPPAFLVHSVDDGTVPVGGTLAYASALAANGVQFELHTPQRGNGHGFGLGHPGTPNDWPALAAVWLGYQGVISVAGERPQS